MEEDVNKNNSVQSTSMKNAANETKVLKTNDQDSRTLEDGTKFCRCQVADRCLYIDIDVKLPIAVCI